MRKHKIKEVTTGATLALLVLASNRAHSQGPESLSLDQAVKIARANAFVVTAAQADVRRAQGAVSEAKSSSMPKLTLDGTYTRFDREQTADVGGGTPIVIRPIDQKRVSLSLVQPIDLFGIYGLGISGAWALKYAADSQVQAAMNDAALTAKSAFYQVIKAEDLLDVAEESLANAQRRLEVAQKKVSAGAVAKFEVIRAESDVAAAEQEKIRSKNSVALTKASLNNALARDPNTEFEIVRPEGLPKLQSNLQTMTESAKSSRPELRALQLQLSFRTKFRQAREKGNLPSLTISARHDRDPDAGGFGSQSDSTTAVAALSIPLYEGGLTRARVKQAKEDEEVAKIRLDQATLGVELEVKQAFLNLETASKLIEVAESNVAKAKEALRLANLRYENEIGTQLEVSDAELQYARAMTSLAAARFDYRDAWARMQRAVGKEDIA